jgi:hypothetical protein
MKLDKKDYEKLIQFQHLILILLIIIDLIFIVTITFFDLPPNDLAFMAYFDLFVCILLFINLVFEYKNRDVSTWAFLKAHIIDIISIIPFNFIFLRYLTLFRVFRILQLFQVIRVVNIRKSNLMSFKYFVQNQLLRTLAIILVIYMVLSSIILFTIDSSFASIFDSFWYNLVTITGVGYGDVTPMTTHGKVLGMLTILIGVLFISVFTAAMSALYMERPEQETRETVKEYLIEAKNENEMLKNEISEMKDETKRLNKKIDELSELIKQKD